MGVGGQRHAPAALPPRKTRYPLYTRLGGPQGRSGRLVTAMYYIQFVPGTESGLPAVLGLNILSVIRPTSNALIYALRNRISMVQFRILLHVYTIHTLYLTFLLNIRTRMT